MITLGMTYRQGIVEILGFRFLDPLMIIKTQLFNVGKNDLFLAALVVALVVHSPVSRSGQQFAYHPVGMALLSSIALSVKPNSVVIVALVWLMLVVVRFRKRKNSKKQYAGWFYASLALLLIPSVLWIVRNLIAVGVIFSEEITLMQGWSIGSNLLNPFLYSFTPSFNLLVIVAALVVLSLISSFVFKLPNINAALVFAVLFIVFVFTPATAFHRVLNVPSNIAWRFGLSVLVSSFAIIILLLEPLLLRVQNVLATHRSAPILIGVCLVSFYLYYVNAGAALKTQGRNWIILVDQFLTPVGSNGYWSAYDFIRRNVRNSVVQVENGQPYYLYGPGYTNTPTKRIYPLGLADKVKQPDPQYYVVFKSPYAYRNDYQAFPDKIQKPEWNQKWMLLYEDRQGLVYKRKP